MADNVAITAGTGTTIAADDIGAGVLAQRVKPVWGPDGTGNDVDITTGKPMPVQVRSATGLIPVGEPTDAKSTATDGTSASLVSIAKQISASVQLGSTAAKQAALGTAGTPSADVLSVQGVSGGTPQPVQATLKTTFGTATPFTKTNAGLSASVTAGWKSNAIDNITTRALDALVGIELAAVNTAPAGTKSLYVYAYGLIEGTAYTSTGDGTIDGTEGTVTFPSVTTLPVGCKLIGTIPYPVQNKAINGGPFSVAAAFGGILPDKWGIALINDTGMTLSVTNIFYQEITNPLV